MNAPLPDRRPWHEGEKAARLRTGAPDIAPVIRTALSDPQSDTNAFSAALKTNVPGREFELTVTAAPPARRPPSFGTITVLGRITLKSSVPGMNPLTNFVYETISPEITVFPPEIQLPAGPLARAGTRRVSIRGNSSNLTLSNPGANVPGVELSVGVIQTNRQYSLSAVFPKGFAVRPGQNIALTVKTDNPRVPVLRIPVTLMPGIRGNEGDNE